MRKLKKWVIQIYAPWKLLKTPLSNEQTLMQHVAHNLINPTKIQTVDYSLLNLHQRK